MLTVQLLIGDDEDHVTKTIRSVRDTFAGMTHEILVGNTGSNDQTVYLCLRSGCRVVPTPQSRNAARNHLLGLAKYDANLHLEPGEVIGGVGDILEKIPTKTPATVQVIQGGVISKQVRLHDRVGCRFVNPVYERWDAAPDPFSTAVIFAPTRDTGVRDVTAAQDWAMKCPTERAAQYCLAMARLGSGDYEGFLRASETYLFAERDPAAYLPVVMTRYYTGVVQCYVKKDYAKSTQNVVACLAANPLMAEFWCLAGDIRYHLGRDYRKAGLLYRNAIEFGKRRTNNDPYPMEISKYEEYPERMAGSCRDMIYHNATITGNR